MPIGLTRSDEAVTCRRCASLRRVQQQTFRAPGAVAATALWLFGATSCLFNPGDEKAVCGADADIAYSGYVTSASDAIALQASPTVSDPFVTIGTTVSSASAITFTGETYYAFSGTGTADAWRSSPSGLSLRLRAQGSGYSLLTFEQENASGQTGLACVLAGVGDGKTASQAALDCDRNDAVIEIEAPLLSTCSCTPYAEPGDLVIESARSAALARCVTSVGGDLRVMPGAPDLVSLAQLTSIAGDAELHYELQDALNGQWRNREIDLSALTSIGGNVDLRSRRGSGQPKTLDTQTGAVTFIGGDVVISTYDNNVQAFGAVASMTGGVTLQGFNGAAGNLDIFGGATFSSLTTVGRLTVQGFFACNSVFNTVTSVTGDVEVRAVRLAPVQSFTNLATVGGDLTFREMKQFGPTWPALTSVGQELQLIDNGTLTALSAVPIGAVSVDGVRIEGQPGLTTLDGTFQAGAGDINIASNPALSQCVVDTWLSDQTTGGWTGTAFVAGTIACP